MTRYNFVGDINNIAERQLEFINEVIEELGFENSYVVFEPVDKVGDNCASCVKRIIITGENENLSMIAKLASTDDLYRQIMGTDLLFKNEHIMYCEVLPKFVELQNAVDIPEEEQLKFPKCYGSLAEQPNEVILLEDLKISDFTVLETFRPLSEECIISMLKNLAMFHSLSYVLKEQEPDIYDNIKENLCDVWLRPDENLDYYFRHLENETLSVLEDPQHKDMTKHRISSSLPLLRELSKANYDNKHNVILHGDAWTDNMMFKYSENELEQSLMIDYQYANIGCPVYDIMHMLFTCTDYEGRQQNYYDWINYYHTELENCLTKFNLNVECIYPREQFDDDLKRYGNVMLGICTFVSHMLIRKSDDAAKNMDILNEEISISQLDDELKVDFKKKMIGIVSSFIEFELII